MHIRWMIRRDMEEVLAIERASFASPWTEHEFVRTLRHRNAIAKVAEDGERITGFVLYELEKTWIELVNLAVHPEFRGRGLGRDLVGELVRKLSAQRRRAIVADVGERNLDGQRFLAACGFRAVLPIVERRFDGEDAYRMILDHGPCGPRFGGWGMGEWETLPSTRGGVRSGCTRGS